MKPVANLTDDEFSHLVHRAVRDLPDAPAALQQSAIGLWPAGGAAAAFKALAQGVVAHIAAALTFDSWAAPAVAAGMRSVRSPIRHLLFSAQGRDIDLRIAPEAGAFSLAGQILGPDDAGTVELAAQGGADASPLSAALDALGEFRIDGIRRGTYVMTLQLGSDRIVLPPVEVGEPRGLTVGDTAALAQARGLLDGGLSIAELPPGADRLALAWALKDLCYEAWTREPTRVAAAAELLKALATHPLDPAVAGEVQALADWMAGIAAVTCGQAAEAVGCFDQAAAGLRAAGRPDPAAQTQVPKIMALSMLGRHDEAVACALATQQELRSLGNLRAAARVSQNLGSLQLFRDAYPEAVRHFRAAAVLFARQGEIGHSVMADIGLANALAAMGDFDEAQRIYDRARMRSANQGLALQQALVDEATGLLHMARGELREALTGFESARRRYEALALPQHLAVTERQLGDAYLELRLLPEALALFQAAQAKFHEQGLVVEEAWALKQRGLAEALLGQAQAGDALAAAAALFAAQRNAVGATAVELARAELALSRGGAAEALAAAEQAVQGYIVAGQPAARLWAEVIRAQARLALGQVEQAGSAFDTTLDSARALQQLPVQVRCLTGQGLVAQASGRQAEATARFESAIELFEELRAALPGDDMRSAFLADHLRPYQERLRMALQAGSADEVLLQLDRFRARALDERMAESVVSGADDESRALRERLNWLYRRVHRLQDEAGAWKALNDELLQTERDLLERSRRARLAGVASVARDGAVGGAFTLQALQTALRPDDALVAYGMLDDELFACVVTDRQVVLQRHMATGAQVLDATQAARFQVDSLRHGLAPLQQHLPRLTARARARLLSLHALLWAPLAAALRDVARVLVVPHGQLANVPFAALGDAQAPLGARFQLSMVPSARAAMRGLLRPPVAARQALALGESSRLPHTALEARFVAGLFERGQALVGEAATVAGLRAGAGAADVLHLACHAQFRSDNPRFSALHLHDGALTVDEAEGLGLRACTVVLSACETGLADNRSGDEMIGLTRAFLVAGASRVLASLWPVDDAVTLAFMGDFYAALTAGASPAAALQRAQAACRAQHPHPYFWAPFTLYGGW